jgi:hypothetical protein
MIDRYFKSVGNELNWHDVWIERDSPINSGKIEFKLVVRQGDVNRDAVRWSDDEEFESYMYCCT